MYIYLIRHKESGKCYVGQTTQPPDKRFGQHLRDAKFEGRRKMVVSNALHKHGWDSFTRHILEVCNCQEELDTAERYWISHYACLVPNGYNVDFGGRGSGVKSEQTKKKISEAKMNHPVSDETKAKLFGIHTGRARSDEAKRKISEGWKKRVADGTCRATHPDGRGPIKHSKETKEKIAAALRGRKMSAESRRKRDETYAKKREARRLAELQPDP